MRVRFSLLPAAALAVALSACGREEPAPAPVEAPAAPAPMPAGASSDVTVAGTIAALEGGLTNLPAAAAVANIDGWIAQLSAVPTAAPIVEDLRDLKTKLGATPLNGAEIGGTLKELGEGTTGAAASATEGKADLERLGALLTQAGTMLDPN